MVEGLERELMCNSIEMRATWAFKEQEEIQLEWNKLGSH